MSEGALWRIVNSKLGPYGKLRRLEDKISLGTADVVYALRHRGTVQRGWLELKYLAKWPSRGITPIHIPSLTAQQVQFAIEEWALDQHYTLLLQVARSYLLLNAPTVLNLFERRYTEQTLREVALVVSDGIFPTREILTVLCVTPTRHYDTIVTSGSVCSTAA